MSKYRHVPLPLDASGTVHWIETNRITHVVLLESGEMVRLEIPLQMTAKDWQRVRASLNYVANEATAGEHRKYTEPSSRRIARG